MEELLRVEGLWKKYSRDLRKSTRYGAMELLGLRKREGGKATLDDSEFWAVRDVSFSVKRGEVLGILGHNGAGKSTLLKTVAGKLKPDAGEVTINGTLGHIIEMSAGFSPTMTGRENVSVRGRLLGRRGKDLEAYIREVEEFADLHEFFDAPVQFYSSGMRSRLGFAASVAIKPDVLILDEVLAVGDLSFRLKCYDKIDDLARHAAVLFVSHSLGNMRRLCSRGIYLEKGRMLHLGGIQEAISIYQDKMEVVARGKSTTLAPERLSYCLIANDAPLGPEPRLAYATDLTVRIVPRDIPADSQIRIVLRNASNDLLMDWNSARMFSRWPEREARTITADLGPLELNPGAYNLFLQVMSPDGIDVLSITEPSWFRVTGEHLFEIAVQRRAQWRFESLRVPLWDAQEEQNG